MILACMEAWERTVNFTLCNSMHHKINIYFASHVYSPAVRQPGSGAEQCLNCDAAGGLQFAASNAAAEQHTSVAGTVLLC